MEKELAKLYELGKEVFAHFSTNRLKSTVFRLLTYLKTKNYERAHNEILWLLNGVNSPAKDEFISLWSKVYLNEDNAEKVYYSLVLSLLGAINKAGNNDQSS